MSTLDDTLTQLAADQLGRQPLMPRDYATHHAAARCALHAHRDTGEEVARPSCALTPMTWPWPRARMPSRAA